MIRRMINKDSTARNLVYNSLFVCFAVAVIHAVTYGRVLVNGEFLNDLASSMNRSTKDVAILMGVQFTLFNASYFLKVLIYGNCCQHKIFDPYPIIIGILLYFIGQVVALFEGKHNYDVFGGCWALFTGLGGGIIYYETFLYLLMALPNVNLEWNICGNHTINHAAFGFCIAGLAPLVYSTFYSLWIASQEDVSTSLWYSSNIYSVWITPIFLGLAAIIIKIFGAKYDSLRDETDEWFDDATHVFHFLANNRVDAFIALLISCSLFQYAMFSPLVWLRPHLESIDILAAQTDYTVTLIEVGGLSSSLLLLMIISLMPGSALWILLASLVGMSTCLYVWPSLHTYSDFQVWGFFYGFTTFSALTLYNVLLIIDWRTHATKQSERLGLSVTNLCITSFTMTVGNLIAVFVTAFSSASIDTLMLASAICVTIATCLIVYVCFIEASDT